MRLVSVSMLKPNMVLAKSIFYGECLVMREGNINIDKCIDGLTKLGIDFVYVQDDKSKGIEILDVISETTRLKCKKALNSTLKEFYSNSILDIGNVSRAIEQMINEILINKDVQVSLNDISASDQYTLIHSVNTTVYSLIIAKELNYPKVMLEKLAIGTLLHDVGKTILDGKILFKNDKLNDDEFRYIMTHTSLGYEALQKCNEITELSRLIALTHHERMDGSGYPNQLKADELHEFSKIVAIADVYDALTSDRCYRKKLSREKAVDYLIKCSDTKYDSFILGKFLKNIAIYPNGSMVRLSDCKVGIVKQQNENMPLRPIVRVVGDENGKDILMYEVDLMKQLSITIVDSEIEMEQA